MNEHIKIIYIALSLNWGDVKIAKCYPGLMVGAPSRFDYFKQENVDTAKKFLDKYEK